MQTSTKDWKDQFAKHTDGTKNPVDLRSDEDANGAAY